MPNIKQQEKRVRTAARERLDLGRAVQFRHGLQDVFKRHDAIL